MEATKARRPFSKSKSTSRLFFNSPQQKNENYFPEQNFFFSPKYEKLHELNRKRSGYLIKKDDKKRQYLRKKDNDFSNPIDNYYFPKFHDRAWWPNGEYIIKRRYNYTGIGLEHYYERNNVQQLKVVEDKEVKEKKDADYLQDFREYYNLKKNEYIITIEHCSSCEEHKNITQHQTDTIFKELAIKYQRIIQERFPFIKVYLKPIEVEIVRNEKFRFPKIDNGGVYPSYPDINSKFKQCRIGAFEIQIATKNEKDEKIVRIIHSKLKTKRFPDVNTVLKKIVSFMPKFNLKLILYDKEDYEDLEKMNNIQINLYLCNSNIIKEVRDSTQEQVLNFISPGRRLLMLREQKLKQEQNFNRNDAVLDKNNMTGSTTNLNNFTSTYPPRIFSALPNKVRGISASRSSSYMARPSSTTYLNNNKNNNMIESFKYKSNQNNLGMSSIIGTDRLNNSLESFYKIGKEINNQKLLKNQLGDLIKRKFSKIDNNKLKNENSKGNDEDEESSESVTVYFDELPYDTYIIETIENSNFQGSLTLLKFNDLNSDNNGIITKYIGLWHQENAILNIHLYTEKEKKVPIDKNGNENNEVNVITNKEKKIVRPPSSNQRRVINNNTNNKENYEIRIEQEPIITGSINISDADDPNSRYKVYPNKRGVYEYKTLPGEYKLEVYNEDYEKIVMKVLLKCGLNTLNIKLKQEKNCDLKVQVLEYNEYTYGNNNNIYSYYNYIHHMKNDANEEIDREELDKNNAPEDNIYIQPVRNAEIQIFKNNNELLVEGITNKKGIMKYLVNKNENNLTIKVNKNGYFRAERFFKRNSNMTENEKGNYDCTMTFILVKIERLVQLNKILFISYSNMCKKIFELDLQNYDQDRNRIQIKDMQEESGIFLATFWFENRPRENDQVLLEENTDEKKKSIKEDNAENENENNEEEIDDFSESINYEEIMRFGFNILPEVIKDDYNKNSYEVTRVNENDLIEHLRNICCEGNVYTPNYDFHINLPKVLSKTIITNKFGQEEPNNENNENNENNINTNISKKEINNKNSKVSDDNQKEDFNGIYWDLGWIDVKNKLYYETSVYFNIEYKPERLVFFENFIDFLQIFIDKRICDQLFTFFNFDLSVLAASDRYLSKKIFEAKLTSVLDEEIKSTVTEEQIRNKEVNEKHKEIQRFIQFICNIVCGYDEDNNIRNDSISFSLLKKKISSNLQNFANYSADGKKENINNKNNEMIS